MYMIGMLLKNIYNKYSVKSNVYIYIYVYVLVVGRYRR